MTKDKTTGTYDMLAAQKQFVTNTRTWATTMRDATWAPWLSVVEQNDTLANSVRPFVEMTRTAHDRWLDLYETQSHEMIDRTADMMKHFRP